MPKIMPASQILLDLPTTALLSRFSEGEPTPGSGSASALLGLVASSMVVGYAALSVSRVKDKLRQAECSLIADIVSTKHRPTLQALFELDSKIFGEVVAARKKRDRARSRSDQKRFGDHARKKLQRATEINLQIAEECLRVSGLGMHIFSIGFRAARGEPATAASSALAGAQSGLIVALLNLSSFRGGKWATDARRRCSNLWQEIGAEQHRLWILASRLRDEADNALVGPTGQTDLLHLLGAQPAPIAAIKRPSSSQRKAGLARRKIAQLR